MAGKIVPGARSEREAHLEFYSPVSRRAAVVTISRERHRCSKQRGTQISHWRSQVHAVKQVARRHGKCERVTVSSGGPAGPPCPPCPPRMPAIGGPCGTWAAACPGGEVFSPKPNDLDSRRFTMNRPGLVPRLWGITVCSGQRIGVEGTVGCAHDAGAAWDRRPTRGGR